MIDNNKAKFYGGIKTKVLHYCILTSFLDNYKPTKDEVIRAKKGGLNDFFELYDDDDIKYYSGYANFNLISEFTILDKAAHFAGCTYIKTRNKAGKMEMV
jgi:hypothetical protein